MLWMELASFAFVMALGQFSPGPDMLLLTRTSLAEGAKAGALMAWGIATGLAVHSTLAVGGLAVLLDHSPRASAVLRWIAAAYLLWLAWGIARAVFVMVTSGIRDETTATSRSRKPFVRGLLCNLFNPKVAVVLMSLLTPFLRGEKPDWWPFALWAVIVFQGGVLWSCWAGLLQWQPLREGYRRARPWIDGAFAVTLASLAVFLILDR